jgi:RNA polymerase sigma-70 factor (ECF subfamily)
MEPSHEIERVIERVLRGDAEAFLGVVRLYGLPIRSYLASQLHHMDQVDDLAQEVFIAAFQRLSSFRRGENFGAWLRGIARHKLYNHFRSSSRRDGTLERFQQEIVEVVGDRLEEAATHDRSEQIERLLHCIGLLPEKMRRVVRAGLEDQKPAVLAEALATSVGAIYNLHYRANGLLRDCMKKEALQ